MTKEKQIVLHCSLCKTKVFATPEDIKLKKFYDQYIIRHGSDSSLTAVQAGTLCEACSKLPLEKRIVIKR